MSGPSSRSAVPALSAPALLAAALLFGIAGCTSRAPESALRPSPVPTSPVEAVHLDSAEVIRIAPAEAERQARAARDDVSVKLAGGFDLKLWAADPLFVDPVAIDVDNQGRVYVISTDRRRSSDVDIRQHRDWMTSSISFQTVDDRRNFLHRELAPERSAQNASWLEDTNGDGSHDWRDLTVKKERLYRLDDTSGDGLADRSTLLLENFHTEVTDVAGGVLYHDGDIYIPVSPDFWRLRDTNGDGVIDTRQAIATGFHTHIGFGGHGMSGATQGPDGRIYWQIGDPGLNTVGPDGKAWKYPNQGVIVRSNPDGSDFEVFAAGMRNTHEFAFDEHGNLVSVDNDGDHPGETERVVYVTNGQDSGWRINWQFGKYTDPDNNTYKVWMDEGMYKPRFDGQAAWFTPPVAAYHAGPAGMVYEPGTALSDRWRKHFFVAEFTGSADNSKIHAFTLDPKGAGFTLGEDTTILTGILTTGIEWGPGGSLYLADWIDGWGTKKRGRIWKLDTPAAAAPVRAETKALLAKDLNGSSAAELSGLLGNADMRVRLRAQFELARRGDVKTLLAAARRADGGLARMHGLWGLEQLARVDTRQGALFLPFLRDSDAEVRAQAAKMLGDMRYTPAGDALVALLKDPAARPRFFAAEALGRIAYYPAVQAIIEMLKENDDRDVYLRGGGTLALARIGEAAPVVALADSPSRALRVDAVVALRRMKDPGVARFLQDSDEYIVTEAARAINDDGSIEAAVPALAGLLGTTHSRNEALLRRVINANLRLGTPEAARRVASFVARAGSPEEMKVDAIEVLGVWPKPSPLDRVDGIYRGTVERDTSIARAAVEPLVAPILASGSEDVKVALLETVGRLRLESAAPALLARVQGDASPQVRVAALRALQAMGSGQVEEALRAALSDRDPTVRMTALELLPALRLPDATAAELLTSALGRGTTQERQAAIETLGKMQGAAARAALSGLVDQLSAGKLPTEVQLEVEEAADSSGSAPLRAQLERYHASKPKNDPVAAFGASLAGGNAQRGRRVVHSEAAQCTRCHSIEVAGAEVGPRLLGVGSRLTREQLLQALVDPNARIAPGFHAPSPMPPMGSLLTKREIRDVVEYLSTLK